MSLSQTQAAQPGIVGPGMVELYGAPGTVQSAPTPFGWPVSLRHFLGDKDSVGASVRFLTL